MPYSAIRQLTNALMKRYARKSSLLAFILLLHIAVKIIRIYRVIRNDCRGFNNKQFGTKSIIVLMFVESQRVHI